MNSLALSYISRLRLDPHPTPDYQVCHTPADLSSYFFGDYYLDSITSTSSTDGGESLTACDTESTPDGLPYCVTFSCYPGTGRLVYCRDGELIRLLGEYLSTSSLLLFHNYLHDVHPFSHLHLPIGSFRDTMILAYNACLGGGGSDDDDSIAGRGSLSLKSLAYRHCNMQMTSFRDTVYPHSVPRLLSYLQSISSSLTIDPTGPTCACGHLREIHLDRGVTGKLKGVCTLCSCSRYKLTSAKKDEEDKLLGLLKRKTDKLITDISTHPSYSYDLDEDEEEELSEKDQKFDPYRRVRKWHDHDHEYLRILEGPVPRPSIADVPEKDLLVYAAKDSDATLRLYLLLQSYYPWLFY